jgi:periplasmic divalent cation tolerance protein
MTDDLCEVTVTAPDAEWLAGMARELVDERLCASAHIVAPIRSIYRWGGAIEDTHEARAFLRARQSDVRKIVDVVTARHPYQVPNVTAVPILDGNPAYLEWVLDATRRSIPSS